MTSVTRSIDTGGYSTFTGTVWYKVYTCNGVKKLSHVKSFKVVQRITATAHPGIRHTIDAAYQVSDREHHHLLHHGQDHLLRDRLRLLTERPAQRDGWGPHQWGQEPRLPGDGGGLRKGELR